MLAQVVRFDIRANVVVWSPNPVKLNGIYGNSCSCVDSNPPALQTTRGDPALESFSKESFIHMTNQCSVSIVVNLLRDKPTPVSKGQSFATETLAPNDWLSADVSETYQFGYWLEGCPSASIVTEEKRKPMPR